MKKFVIITLILALVAGAVFAQDGSWSVGGSGEIGTVMNFVPETYKNERNWILDSRNIRADNDRTAPQVGGMGYNYYDWYGGLGAELNIRYNAEGFTTGLTFDTKSSWVDLYGMLAYSDDARAFEFSHTINPLLTRSFEPGRLWGYYKFLDNAIHLEVAANSRDTNYWFSNDALADLFAWSKVWGAPGSGSEQDFGMGFTKVDHHDYLVVDVAPASLIDGLSFGVMIPALFNYGGGDNANKWTHGTANVGWSGQGWVNYGNNGFHKDLVEEALLQSKIGVKFATGPVEIALQFSMLGRGEYARGDGYKRELRYDEGDKLNKLVHSNTNEALYGTALKKPEDALKVKYLNTGLYLGGKFNINDNLNAGLAFEGMFQSKEPELGVAANVGFNSGAFGASLKAGIYSAITAGEAYYQYHKLSDPINDQGNDGRKYGGVRYVVQDGDKGTAEFYKGKGWYKDNAENNTVLGLKPGLTFNLVENYLAVSLDAYLFWRLGLEERAYRSDTFGYEVTPQIWFNVAGTGAGAGYWWPNTTAIIVRYKLGGTIDGSQYRAAMKSQLDNSTWNSPSINAVDITFKWSF